MVTRRFGRRISAALLATTALTLALATGANACQGAGQTRSELFAPGLHHARSIDGFTETPGTPPLFDGLGAVHLPADTASTRAQAFFDQGLRLAWAFNHAEARRAFREAQRLDSACGLCVWGEALVLGPNINDGMRPAARDAARRAVARAAELSRDAAPLQQALIAALAERYADDGRSRDALNHAYADAMADIAAQHPDDANILTLYAEAMMTAQPWDYWAADGVTPKGRAGQIVAALERALEIDPDHPAAAHLYIHAVEASAAPERAEPVADRLRGAMPGAGHMLHMPAHIYMRLGRFADSVAVNRDAVAADESYLAAAGEAVSPLYRYGYYPHNVHFLMVSAQMAGLADEVIASANKLARITSPVVGEELAWTQAIQTAPFAAHAQFSDPATILALSDPGDKLPFVQAFWRYARGIAQARAGDPAKAAGELEAIHKLSQDPRLDALEAQYLPARTVLAIAGHVLEGRIAQHAGDLASAEAAFRAAARLQDEVPYMEPPYWYYPVSQSLGAVLLQQDRPGEAAAAFRAALDKTPGNGWAVWGLLQAERRLGTAGVADSEARLARTWLGDPDWLSLDRL
jgi:tetratricopeptide (TPR) repeat protein